MTCKRLQLAEPELLSLDAHRGMAPEVLGVPLMQKGWTLNADMVSYSG